ncbi:MAG: T9SS type A sorting domain-containing protein [Flavobacteriales bacterium]|nr:T9SS type A sorting domain-containing protein [Flavobacteriales bacterium]
MSGRTLRNAAIVLCAGMYLLPSAMSGQCANNNTLVGTAVTPPCPGSTSVPCVQGGQYALVNVVNGNTYTFQTCGGATWDTEITLYNNAGGASLGYNDDGCAPQSTVTWTANYTGQLRVVIDQFPCASNTTCATLTITCAPPPPAATNDNPCNATALTPATTCVNTVGSNAGATATTGPPAPTCASYAGGDVWFSVVVPAGGAVTLSSTAITGSLFTDGGMAAYTATSCSGPFTQVGCNDDFNGLMPLLALTGLAPGSTLWVRFWEFGNNAVGQFNICATIPPPPPTNDNPCQATALTVNNNCVYGSYSNVGTTSTTAVPAPSCGFYFGSDVWFSFVAPASGIALVQTQAGTLTDADMSLYSATACNGTFTEILCDDFSGPGTMPALTFTNLNPGQTYYLRVWGYAGATGTFNLCVSGPTNLPAGNCVYMLEMFDSFGDGWGGSTVGISINGGPYTNYTVTGAYNYALIGLNIGQVLAVQYTAAGGFQGEISYSLSFLAGGQTVFNSGSPPATGVVFTQTIDCNPPPASQQDCLGGTTICNSLGINNNSSNTGDVEDLNLSNQGCLSAGERQGTWYYFSPSTGGTIGFTINPSNPADDYDFAIWGPMTTVDCPPTSPPLRCSFAAPSGATGLGNGAIDLSEGAGGDKWVAPMNVLAGQVYIMYVDNFSTSGQAFSLTWNLSGGASLDCTVLPIELLQFQATPGNDHVLVEWSTASAYDVVRYEVERSAEGTFFSGIGGIDAIAGIGEQDHQHVDQAPLPGMSYYRLAQHNADGSVERSHVVAVDRGNEAAPSPYPNPAGSDLFWDVHTLVPQGRIELVDALGRTVRVSKVTQQGPTQLPVGDLPMGVYTVRAFQTDGQVKAAHRFLKH